VARALHFQRRRPHRPFVSVNCGGHPGHTPGGRAVRHVKGAFTTRWRPARTVRVGRHRHAFLDEIAIWHEPANQAPARLQEREFLPLGDTKKVQWTCASRRDQHESQGDDEEGKFARTSTPPHVIHIQLPSLRERSEDVPLLHPALPEQVLPRDERPGQTLHARGDEGA